MKTDFHFHFYSRIVIMAVLALFVFSLQKSVDTVAQEVQGTSIEIGGWAWSELTGWISLNCHNDFNGDGMTTSRCVDAGGVDYGLEIYRDFADDRYVRGCAWSGNPIQGSGQCSISGGVSCVSDGECPGVETCEFTTLGWICFSDPTANPTAIFAPDGGISLFNSSSTVNALCSEEIDGVAACAAVDSYGTIISLEDPLDLGFEGWKFGFPIENEISDIGDDPDYPISTNPIEGCFNCHEDIVYGCSLGTPEYTCDGDGVTSCTCDPIGDPSCQDGACIPTGDPLFRCSLSYDATSCLCASGESTCSDVVNCPDVGSEVQTCDAIEIKSKCENCLEYFYYNGTCSNDPAISCVSDDVCGVITDLCDPVSTCSNDIEQTCAIDGDCGVGNTCIERSVGSLKKVLGGYSCTDCSIESVDNTCGVNPYKSNINSCDICGNVYKTPGLMLDNKYNTIESISAQACDTTETDPKEDDFCERGALCGWGWNSWAAGVYGLGWFQFQPRVVISSKPYLFIEGGNIYSKGNVFGKYSPPYGKYNSTYLIESGGRISNFVSSSTLAGLFQGELSYRPDINFLNLIDTKYKNALGTVDYTGLITDTGGSINKYGSQIVKPIDDAAFDVQFNNALDNKVLWVAGDLSTVADITILNGTGTTVSGAGVVVVEGNLTIVNNITHDPTPGYTNLKQIPSLVWIVKGDLYIDDGVTEVAGNFIILGDDTSTDNPPCSGEPSGLVQPGCGQFISAYPTDELGVPLVVNGSVIARYFNLGRLYHSNNEPAERFINDGRLQTNPPKGMVDFSKAVPRFE